MINDLSFEVPGFVMRLLAAGVLGAALGLERDIHGRPAGLRTHILVSTGSALFMLVSVSLALYFGKGFPADPGRIASQIITGIGFIGAGTIIKEGFTIRGLTTASCLWVAAGIGMACGAGFFLLALLTTLIALFSLLVLNRVEKFYRHDNFPLLVITLPSAADTIPIAELISSFNIQIVSMDISSNETTGIKVLKFSLRAHFTTGSPVFSGRLFAALRNLNSEIINMEWINRDMRE